MFLINAKYRIGYNLTGGGYFLTHIVPTNPRILHRVDEWLELLRYLKVDISQVDFHFLLLEREKQWAYDFFRREGITERDFIVGIHPGARIKATRCWSLEGFIKVGEYLRERYNAKILFFIEPNGYGENIPLKKGMIKSKFSLGELISVLSKLDLFICNDSGPMHIANILGTPTVAIIGPGDVEAIGPYNKNKCFLIKKEIACRPCYDSCKFKEPFCLTRIELEEVIKCVEKAVENIVLKKITK